MIETLLFSTVENRDTILGPRALTQRDSLHLDAEDHGVGMQGTSRNSDLLFRQRGAHRPHQRMRTAGTTGPGRSKLSQRKSI